MLWCKDVSKVIKMTQENVIIDEIDVNEIWSMLRDLSWDNCKLIMNGNELCEMKTKSEDWDQIAIA